MKEIGLDNRVDKVPLLIKVVHAGEMLSGWTWWWVGGDQHTGSVN